MKQKIKKSLALLLTLAMCLSLFPMGAIAEETVPAETTVEESLVEASAADHVVISQVYGGGGNAGAPYTNDFIELYNPTSAPVSLAGWSVQYASAKGAFSTSGSTSLTGTIKAGGYYLVQEAAGAAVTDKPLPTPDDTGTIAMGAKEFKVALVKNTEAITGKNDEDVVDFVGAGAANEFEGSAASEAASNSTSIARNAQNADTDDNSADFKAQAPNPRNSTPIAPPTQVATPKAAPAGSTDSAAPTVVASGTEVVLSCDTASTNIYYTTATTGEPAAPTKSSTKYTDPIEITADMGIKAIAVDSSTTDPLSDSDVLTAYYKVATQITIADARDAKNIGKKVAVEGTVTFTDGRNVAIQDSTGGIFIDFGGTGAAKVDGKAIALGDVLSVTGTLDNKYGELIQLVTPVATRSSEGAALPVAASKTITELLVCPNTAEGQRVTLTGVLLGTVNTGGDTFVSVGNEKISLYKMPTPSSTVYPGCTVTVTGVLGRYGANSQLRVAATSDVVLVSEPAKVATPVPSVESGESLKAGDKVTFTCLTPGVTIQYNTEAAAAADEKWQAVPNDGITMPDVVGERTFYVRAIKTSKDNSEVLTLTYTIGQAAMGTIAEARKTAQGEQVYIKGVIVADAGSSFFVQDAIGGICIKGKLSDVAPAKLGDEVTVRAYVLAPYNGLFQIGKKDDQHVMTVAVTSTSPTPITPQNISVAMLNSGFYEGQLVKLTGVTLYTHGGTVGLKNHTIKQGSAQAAFRANLSDSFKQGDTLDIVGVASIFNTVQLLQQQGTADKGVTKGSADLGTVGDPIEKLVAWNMGDKTARPPHAAAGTNKEGAELTISGANAVDGTARGYSSGGWDGGTNKKYWQAKFSSKGVCDLAISSYHASSNSGPAAFYMQYSVDGINFTNLPGSEIKLKLSADKKFGEFQVNSMALPPDINNQDNVYIRWVMGEDSQFSKPGVAVPSGGSSQINGIVISGMEYYGPNDVAPVKASPSAVNSVKLGTSVTLTSVTPEAKIYYTTDGSEPSESSTLYTAPIVLNALPTTIRAVAYKDDKASLTKSVFEYTQIKMGDVSSNKLDNSPVSPTLDRITLTAEKGAAIQYRITPTATEPSVSGEWLTYTAPLALTSEQFPMVLEAKATAAGCLDSDVAVYHFTLSAGAPKNYFGQLHSHTAQYSDGAGTLADALTYISGTAKSNNVQFVAFTDHSNYFDGGTKGVNPADALYDMTKATAEAQAVWKGYRDAVADFNTAQAGSMLALAGFEMTWSGGPGHINTFNTPGIVSRNNPDLNDKSNSSKDLGMQNYYSLLSRPEGATSVSQFNHPGTTFGDFTEFSYWNPVIDQRMCLVEVGNGEGAIGSGGYFPSYEEYTKALDKGWHVAPTNNQDNHKGKWGDANTARSVIYTNDFTEQGVYQAMKDRRVYATEDKNLEIVYTVNDMVMGSTIIQIPDTLNVKGVITDPDTSERISKVELIVNGGRILKTWTPEESNTYTAEATFTKAEIADYSYFYLRVTEADKDIAVTAPVWVGAPVLTGIASLTSGTAMPVIGEPMEFTTSVFNNEEVGATLTSISYAIKDGATIESATPGAAIASKGSALHKISFTPTKAGTYTVVVTAVITVEGKNSTYTKSLNIKVLDPSTMPYIGIDGSHFNEYVMGNYYDSMGNFALLAYKYNLRTNTLKTSADLIAACSNPKYKMLVLTAPSRRNGIALRDPYAVYSDTEIAAIKTFAEGGGTLVFAGWSDSYESYKTVEETLIPAEDHMAAQQNKILTAIGARLRLSDDASLDDSHNSTNTAANNARLYFSNYNFANPLTNGIVFDPAHIYDGQNNIYTQVFSQYGGSTIYAVDAQGAPATTLPASVSPIVSGFDTTKSVDRDGDGLGGVFIPKYPVTQGTEGSKDCVLVAASETLTHANGKTSMVVVSGGAFMSNFEVQADAPGDNNAVLGYSNYNILENLIEQVNPPVITEIAAVQAAPEGKEFIIEGTVTANASGFDKDTAFFDCTYIQDATGGINVFPVAGNYQIGQKVRISGTTSSYGGERQLAVSEIKMLNATPAAVTPKAVTTQQAATGAVRGQLVKIEGVIVSFAEAEGAIQTIIVRDDTGYDARVFIDGYITKSKDVALRTNLAVGNKITAVGLASYDNFFDGPPNRIRIRDRADIVCTTEKPELKPGVSTATITIPPTGFAAGMAGAENDDFLRTGIALADPVAGKVAVTGELAYKEGFTGFWQDNAAMQEGNFIGLRLMLPNYPGLSPVLTFGDKTITAPDGYTAGGNPYYDFIKRISTDKENFTIIVDLDGAGTAYTPTTYTFDLTGLTLTAKPVVGGGGGGGTPTVKPGDVKESDTSVEIKLPTNGAKLNAAASEKVVAANATKPITITGANMTVTIPVGTLSKGADVNAMLVNPKDKGNVIQVTKPDGTKVILPLAAVGGGSAAYLANVVGTYKIIDNTKTFPDTANHWAESAIGFVTSHEFFKGTEGGGFSPEMPMTRGMLVTVLSRIDGGKTAQGGNFVDVPATAWYAKEVAWAAQNKLIEGDGNTFGPEDTLTREQLCVILARYLKYAGLTLSETGKMGEFPDAGSVSPWAADAMTLAVKTGLIGGKTGGLLDPQGQASRAEIATILQRFVEGVVK